MNPDPAWWPICRYKCTQANGSGIYYVETRPAWLSQVILDTFNSIYGTSIRVTVFKRNRHNMIYIFVFLSIKGFTLRNWFFCLFGRVAW